MFLRAEIEIDRFVRQTEFFKDDGSFPEIRFGRQMVVSGK